jgi:predicted transcriptional regulator
VQDVLETASEAETKAADHFAMTADLVSAYISNNLYQASLSRTHAG